MVDGDRDGRDRHLVWQCLDLRLLPRDQITNGPCLPLRRPQLLIPHEFFLSDSVSLERCCIEVPQNSALLSPSLPSGLRKVASGSVILQMTNIRYLKPSMASPKNRSSKGFEVLAWLVVDTEL
jgi:hypothetical protein